MKVLTRCAASVLVVSALAACADAAESAEAESLALQQQSLPDPQESDAPWLSAGLPPTPRVRSFTVPRGDEDLAFIARDGSTSLEFGDCVSKSATGSSVTADGVLPVGNGNYIECTTRNPAPATAVIPVTSKRGARYCLFGAVDAYRPGGDPRLTVTLGGTPASAPWTFKGTSQQAFDVLPANINGWGTAWPLWIELHYKAIDLRPARNAGCAGVF